MRKLFKQRVEGEVYNDAYFSYFFRQSVENRGGFLYVSTFFPLEWFGVRFYVMYKFGDVRFLKISFWPFVVHPKPLLTDTQMNEADLLLKAAKERARKAEIEKEKAKILKKYNK